MDDIPKTRVCNGPCGKEFPLTEEYFYKNYTGPNGFLARCKLCHRKARIASKRKHIEAVRHRDKIYNEFVRKPREYARSMRRVAARKAYQTRLINQMLVSPANRAWIRKGPPEEHEGFLLGMSEQEDLSKV